MKSGRPFRRPPRTGSHHVDVNRQVGPAQLVGVVIGLIAGDAVIVLVTSKPS
jgi:hypothetical protein